MKRNGDFGMAFGLGFGEPSKGLSFNEMRRIIWPHSFGAMPFIGLFAYQVGWVWPMRPTVPDVSKGYTIATEVKAGTVYVSSLDMTIMFGAWLIAAVIICSGVWRAFRAAKLKAE